MDSSEKILKRATELVAGDRQLTHGDKVPNHQNIAALWNAFLINRHRTVGESLASPLGPHDVALMMALVKIARTQLGAYNPDNYVDLAGYAGVAGEIMARSQTND